MFCYQESVSKGAPMPCTIDKWNELIDSPKVKNICAQIAALDTTAADYNDRKQALKKKLPIIIPHAASFKNNKRISADAIPSGLAMLDVDHVDHPRLFIEQNKYVAEDRGQTVDEFYKSHGIVLIAITASGQGLRVIGKRLFNSPPKIGGEAASSRFSGSIWGCDERAGGSFRTPKTVPEGGGSMLESIESAQARMAEALGITEYDAVTKDLARASYIVPRDYILWMDEAELFAERDWTEDVKTLPLRQGEYPKGEGVDSSETDTLSYRGIPYADIVEEPMVATGNAGGAVLGERNTVYFALANYMRYICDFNKELLLRVLPDFGLTEQERLQTIASALGRPRKDQLPVILQSAIATCEREKEVADGGSPLPKASEMELPKLPKLLRILCRRLPSSYRPAMLIASLPVLGTLATRIRFNYLDMQEQSLSFFSCITAPAASGKSFIRRPIDLMLTPINEQDKIEREKEQQYKEKLRTAKNSKFQPEDPHACPRNNGIAISVTKLLQLMTYSEGKHLIGIGEEMDTLVKSERAGAWSQKSDIYRLAFDNAEYGQAYMSDTSFSAHVRIYYNLLLTGTPNSMRRFFKDMEDGMVTRVCFAQLPDTSFAEIPVFAPYTEAEKAEVIRWARRLDTEQGTIESPAVSKAIAAWLEEKRRQASDADNHAMDTFRRRAAVIGFRAGMLCYLLEDHKETDVVTGFATWIAEFVFRNQMELWGNQMELTLTNAMQEQDGRGVSGPLLELLPQDFTTADLIQLRAKKGQNVSTSSIKSLLKRWKQNKRITRLGEGQWRRLE